MGREGGDWSPLLPGPVASAPPPPLQHSGMDRAGRGSALLCQWGGWMRQSFAGSPQPLAGRLLGQEVPTVVVASEGKASEHVPGKSSLPGPQMVYNSGRSECSGARRPGSVSAMPSGGQGASILLSALLGVAALCTGTPPALLGAQRQWSTGALSTCLLWGLHLAQLEILGIGEQWLPAFLLTQPVLTKVLQCV